MRWATTAIPTAPLDLRADWREAEYCAVDVETTGLHPRRDSIVSVGLAEIRNGRIVCPSNYYSLVRPECPVSVASVCIHGLRATDLEHAPAAPEVGREVAARLAGRVVVAHAAWIERAFLSRLLRRAQVRFTSPVIDTAALARGLGCAHGTTEREPSLERLARRLSLPVYAPHHALGDAVTTAAVFLVLATRAVEPGHQPGRKPPSLRTLLELSAKYAN